MLILGGTAEARALAAAIAARFGGAVTVVTSLAGRTRTPAALPGRVRIGGFGGPEKLAAYLAAERIAVLVDATHPFATRISAAARTASAVARVPLLRLARAPWKRRPGDRWTLVGDAEEAAARAAALGTRALVTIGSRDLAAFAARPALRAVVRTVDPLPAPAPHLTMIAARGPFGLAGERALMRAHAIDVLVTKASGGAATAAKLAAARALGIPVVMIRRPRGGGAGVSRAAVLARIARLRP